MKKFYFARSFTVFFILLGIGLSIFISPANAQEKNSANTNQIPTPSPTPTAAPTPILLSDIITQAETTSKRLQEIQTGLIDNPGIADIEQQLPLLTEQLNLQEQETNQLLTSQPSLETLRKVEQDWESFASQFPEWKDDLKTQAVVLDKQINELKNLNLLWMQTSEASKQILTPDTTAMRNDNRQH